MKYLAINFFLLLSLLSNAAQAAIAIDSVSLTDDTVATATDISVNIAVTDSSNKWKATGYAFSLNNNYKYICLNNENSGTFLVTTPADTGIYNLSIRVYENNGCSTGGNKFDTYNYSNSITVLAPPTISIEDTSVEVAGNDAVFTVSLSDRYYDDIIIDYATSDGTAVAGSDYTAPDDTATLTIAKNTISAEIRIETSFLGSGTFNLTLSAPSAGTFEKSSATATIIDQPELVAGRVTLNETTTDGSFTHVCFDTPFSTVPLVFSIPTTEDNSDRLALRIRNVTTAGFEIAQVESTESAKTSKNSEDAPNGNVSQTVDFLAIVAGDYNLEGGAKMRVSSLDTKAFQSNIIGGDFWETVSTSELGFSKSPSIIASIQTMNNETNPFPSSDPFLATTIKGINTTEFKIALERAETNTTKTIISEEIGYIAITTDSNGQFTDAISFESFQTSKNINGINSCKEFNFSNTYSNNPLVIASQNTREGNNGGWVKRCSISSTSVGFSIVEDMDKDTETSHVNEQVGGLALYGTFEDFAGSCPTSTETIDHYEIVHDGSGLTCASEEVTIKACTDSDCSSLGSETVTLDLLGNGNTLTSTSFTGSTEVIFSYTTPETLTLSLDNKSITADNDDQCSTGSTSSCDIVFSDAGFRFLYGSNNATSIDNQISGTEFSDALKLQAVEDIDGVCTGIFTGNVDVDLAQENISPSGTDGLLFEINGQNIAKYPDSTSETLYFDSDSIATITAPIYNDAGQITLHADYNQNDINLTGSSNNFWVSPSYLKVDAKNTSDTTIDGASPNAIITHKAGENFALNISAYNSQDEITENYSPGNMQFMLTRTGPLDSTSVDGTLTYAENKTVTSSETSATFSDVTLTSFNDGESLYSSAQYSEVGLLNLDIQDSNYGGEDIIISANDINIGRFTPYYFEITSTTDGALSGGNPFVYSGQLESTDSSIGQISYSTQPEFIITAKSANDNTTKNYSGDYMKLEESGVIRVTPNTDAAQVGADNINLVNLSTTFNTATINDSLGMVKYQFANSDNYIYTREENAIIAPFTADIELQITSITDNDGITANDSDSDTSNGILTLSPTGVEIRFGRWNINNSYGPEIADLRVPMQVQYWDGTRFSTNTNDSFTTFDSNNANITTGTLSTTPSISGSGTFSNGITNILTLSAPGANNQGNLTLTMEVPSWLQFDWDNEDTYTDDPDALITFGLYRGNDRVIYRGEVFE
jgi:MSHA biogenesis protein MshQ